MAYYGVNFRATSGYVTDGTGETYDLGAVYPVTRGGLTFGWDADLTVNARDRNAGNDRRLAGLNQTSNNGTQRHWRLDLPSTGTFDIRLAFGDASNAQTIFAELREGSSGAAPFATIGPTGTSSNQFLDATGTALAAATWDDNGGTALSHTFSSTAFFISIADNSGNSTCIAHVSVEDAAAPVVITTLPLSNNTGSLLASTSGISAFVHDPTTGDLVVLVTGLSTDADGVLEITDALLDADTSYRVVIRVTGTGAEGMDTYTAA
jgi:hypothetical protein